VWGAGRARQKQTDGRPESEILPTRDGTPALPGKVIDASEWAIVEE
jgi:hypothetical protein